MFRIIFWGILVLVAFAQVEVSESKSIDPGKIKEVLGVIRNLPPEIYYREIDEYRGVIEKHFKYKKGVCNGEFSTIILEGKDNTPKTVKKKLSKSERILCFREMRSLQLTFIQNMFIARKRYLDYLHKLRIVELQEAQKKAVKNLQSRFAKELTPGKK